MGVYGTLDVQYWNYPKQRLPKNIVMSKSLDLMPKREELIENGTLQRLGNWFFPRSPHPHLLFALAKHLKFDKDNSFNFI
jgi:hypothetical protein